MQIFKTALDLVLGTKNKGRFVTVMDIGESKIVCVTAYINPIGDVFIKSIYQQNTDVMVLDKVKDKSKLKNDIKKVIDKSEEISGIKIKNVCLNINSSSVETFIVKIVITNNNIKKSHLQDELKKIANSFKNEKKRTVVRTAAL
ncbi:MAG: hypothetical protein LBC92_01480, partial [Rickettsiales bacterium]|nr:hypothetical protein [Rickettsiales bacterium]